MLHEMALEQSLLLNFFNSSIYFVFENDEEKESFIDFIKIYDYRLKDGFDKKTEMKSAMWKLSGISHQYQMEWNDDEESFKKYDAIPISYSIVMNYADVFKGLNEFMNYFIRKI